MERSKGEFEVLPALYLQQLTNLYRIFRPSVTFTEGT